ncbi:MAG TPA: pilus assembly protein TadG-related protein [Chloroflexota bacterium]|nr:pilus assembly protein TadG-related protein [Chloroflexota bacterium]
MARRSSAQALVWFTLALPLFISIAGLAIDGGVLLASRRQLQSVADGAARAGATRLDLDRLRGSGGTDVQLDPTLARDATRSYLAERLARELDWQVLPTTRIDVATRRVRVTLQGAVHTAFLRVVHIDSVPVQASAFADVQYGIHAGDGG